MVRIIRFEDIGIYCENQIKTLVSTATLQAEVKLKERTPVGPTGRLRISWQTVLEPYTGRVFNNLPYAAPVVAGTNFPPSWGGQYRTRQGAEPFLDIVAKDVQTWTLQQAARLGRDQ
jgi:hypothetical protein